MNAFLHMLLLFAVAVASQGPSSHPRSKRSLIDLKGIIKCTTGRSLSSYLWYGCYCGVGGHGKPKDDTDKCCYKHDCCYEDAKSKGCNPLTDDYDWKCEDKMVACDHLTDRCERILCECDRDVAKCLSNARYNWYYAWWPNFLCGSGRKCD
ncbi:phospholipase A2-like [Dunckerocampus dactyliophorus]|uniref:phospholipase A2-like n=1 Tax=Dunckerocampus dactyliophorus TaxID=161453 RepID=UPI0024058BF8|nr:phospholipase A2-like [Dunckerocampus dactyliophorus]